MNNPNIKAFLGNALDLSRFSDNSFDLIIMFGPMYHLHSKEEKIKALSEAKRILKDNGFMFICYYMNEYAIIKHGFIDGFINEAINKRNKTLTNKSNNVVKEEYKINNNEWYNADN